MITYKYLERMNVQIGDKIRVTYIIPYLDEENRVKEGYYLGFKDETSSFIEEYIEIAKSKSSLTAISKFGEHAAEKTPFSLSSIVKIERL